MLIAMSKPRIVATIEARMGSSRLPGKVLLDLGGQPMLARMVERLKRCQTLDHIVIATTDRDGDAPIVSLAEQIGVGHFRGSEDDVLARVLGAARAHGAEVIVELTGDCPLMDPAVVDRCVNDYLAGGADYVANVLAREYPRGMDVQVFATEILADVARRTDDPTDHEHVSLYIYRHPELYRLRNVPASAAERGGDLEITLDTPEDRDLIRAIWDALAPVNPAFGCAEIVALLRSRPDLRALVDDVRRKHV